MCFNSTTEVSNTGLGDDQYNQLQSNQDRIGNQIETGFNATGNKLNTIGSNISGLGTRIDSTGNTIRNNMNSKFSSLNSTLNSKFNSANNSRDAYARAVLNQMGAYNTENRNRADNINQNVQKVGTDVEKGFAEQGLRFDELDTSLESGFAGTAQNINDLGEANQARFDQVDASNQQTYDTMNNSFNNTNDNIDTMQTEVLGGQGDILNDLLTAKAERDAYQQLNADDLGNIQEGQDTFKSNFDQYVDNYVQNANIQNDTLGSIQSGLSGFATDITGRVGSIDENLSSGNRALSSQINDTGRNITDVVQGGFNDAAQNMNTFGTAMASQYGDIREDVGAINQQTSGLPSVMNNLAAMNDLPVEMRQQFYQMGQSFDEQGNLIRNSIDQNGNVLSRQMDDQGNMIINRFNSQGDSMGVMTMNLNEVMANVQKIQANPIQNAGRMGGLSPANKGFGGDMGNGLMTPFGASSS